MKKVIKEAPWLAGFGLLVLFGLAALLVFNNPIQRAITVVSAPWESGEVLVIDAGHGGIDGGASSADGVLESTVNLEIAQRINALANVFGVQTVMTRKDENSIHSPDAGTIHAQKVSDLKNRVKIINETQGAFLISIHQNSFTQTQYSGAQVFYSGSEKSLATAETVQENLRLALNPDNDRQVSKVPKSVYLFQKIQCDGILVECGFLSNTQEAQNLVQADYQKKIACAILSAYLTQQAGTS